MTLTRKKSHQTQLFVRDTLVHKYLQVAQDGGHTDASVLGLEASTPAAGGASREHHADPFRDRLLARLVTLLPGRALAFEAGLTLQPRTLGHLGSVIASSPTLGDALTHCQRFWHIYGSGMVLDVVTVEEQCRISVDTQSHIDRRVRRRAIECLLAGIHKCVVKLCGRQTEIEILLDGSEPIYVNEIRRHVNGIRYGADRCEYRFPSSLLQQPSKCADPTTYRMAVDACLAEENDRKAREASVANFVAKHLILSTGGYPTFAKIAQQAAMSQRTMRRRLHEEGMPFSQLLLAARYEDARRLLAQEDLEIGEIASLLGYRERANFTRAFCKWHGVCPRQYREALRRTSMTTDW